MQQPQADSDASALAERYIPVTPMQFDLTQRALLAEMSGSARSLPKEAS